MKTLKLTKLLSLVLACVLLMGAFGTLSVSATTESNATAKIVGKNIYEGEKFAVVFAVETADVANTKVLLYDAEGNSLGEATLTDETDPNGNPVYVTAGVPAFRIDEKIIAKVAVNGNVIEESAMEYSVLDYLYERLYEDAKAENSDVSEEQIAMYEALIAYAKAAQVVYLGEDRITGTEPSVPGWKLVTDASVLKEGMQIVIAAKDSDYALSTNQKSSNRGAATITKDGNTITFGDDVQIITLEAGVDNETWAFNVGEAGYLYSGSSSGNQLKTKTALDGNGSWKITIADGAMTIMTEGGNRPYMQYNPNNGSPLFNCYSGASQQALCIYAWY